MDASPAAGAWRVAVVGSANLDETFHVPRLPEPGQTVLASSHAVGAGGKGLNQAIASARHLPTALVAVVGSDSAGELLLQAARAAGVDVSEVDVVPGPSGRALITVDEHGENHIVVDRGANADLDGDAVRRALDRLRPDLVLVQSEIPAEAEDAALRWATANGCRAVWNLSPVRPVAPELLALADPLVVNEGEAAALAVEQGIAPDTLTTLCRSVVLTLGSRGASWTAGAASGVVPAPRPDRVVDTTGAGDELAGVVAAGLASGHSLSEAVESGVAAASAIIAAPRAER